MSWNAFRVTHPLPESQEAQPSGAAPGASPAAPQPYLIFRAHPARAFSSVPTHAVGMPVERRGHARAALRLPLRLTQVNHEPEPVPVTLLTRNISSTGVYFLVPKPIAEGAHLELEVALVERPLGRGGVRMATLARVVRIEPASEPGWYGVAATFEDLAFERDEALPARFHQD